MVLYISKISYIANVKIIKFTVEVVFVFVRIVFNHTQKNVSLSNSFYNVVFFIKVKMRKM